MKLAIAAYSLSYSVQIEGLLRVCVCLLSLPELAY